MALVSPHLLRENVVLDQKTVDSLKLPPGRSEVVIVATRLSLNRATFVDKDVLIFADHVDGPLESSHRAITLTRSAAATNTTGEQGCSLTIWTRTLGEAGGRSFGQTGGKGLPGKPADDLICTFPDPQPDDPKPPFDPQEGPTGGQGKPGAKGGKGGAITINVVGTALDGSTPPPKPQDWLGVGGSGGQGGKGGSGGKGCPRFDHLTGEEGPEGGTLGKGDDLAAIVQPVTEQDLIDEYKRRVLPHAWGHIRVNTADKLARLGAVGEAERELKAAEQLADFSAIATGIRRRMRHRLTPFGVESDVDVRPAIDQHRAAWAKAVTAYKKMALPVGGHSVFAATDAAQMIKQHADMRDAHAILVTSELEQLRNERDERLSNLAVARGPVADLVQACRDRIADTDAPPTITLPGGVTIEAGVLAGRIVDLLAAPPSRGDRRLLAADLDLLAPAATNDRYPMPGKQLFGPSPEQQLLLDLRAGAIGLTGDLANPAAVISFARVRDELAVAGGDPRLLLELAELVDLAQRGRIVELRRLQADEGALVQQDLVDSLNGTDVAISTPPSDSFPLELLARRYLDALRDAGEVLAWRSHAAERSVALYTLDTTRAGNLFPESAVMPTGHATGFLFDADPEPQFTKNPPDAGPFLDFILTQAGTEDAGVRLAEYLDPDRGTFIEGPGDSPVDQLEFDSDKQPEVLTRLRANRNVWFPARVGQLSAARFEHKVVGVGFRFTGLREVLAPGQTPTRKLQLTVEHSGISQQRRLDGAVVRQHLLPAQDSVTVHQLKEPNTETYSDEWSGFMRFDQTPPQPDPNDPGKFITQAGSFPFWGRGAAAGWRFSFDSIVDMSALTRFVFEIEYDGFVPHGQTSIRRIEQPLGALVPGRTVQARAVLTGPAPAGGFKVSLSSDNPAALSVPAFITVAAGAEAANIPVKVVASSGKTSVRLAATGQDGFTRRAVAFAAAPALPTVITLDAKQPGDVNGNIGGLAFDGDRLIGGYTPALLHPDGTLEGTGPGGMISVATSAAGMGAVQRFNAGRRIRSVAVANRRAYLVNGDPQAFGMTIVDLATNKPMVDVPIGFSPIQVTVDAAANLVYLSNHGQKRIDVHHGTTGVKLGSVAGLRGPQGSAFDPHRNRLYVACSFQSNGPADAENGLAVIDRVTGGGHVLNRIIPMEGRNGPMDVAFDSVRDLIHVANLGVAGEHAPGISTFRPSTLTMLGHTAVPGPLICLDVHLATGAVVSGGPASMVHIVDGVNRRYLTSHPVTSNVQCITVHQPTGATFAGNRVTGEIARLAPVDIATTTWR